jgi:hypothetical protein
MGSMARRDASSRSLSSIPCFEANIRAAGPLPLADYHDSYAGYASNWHDWQSWGHDYTTGNLNITGWYANLVTCGVYTEYVVKQTPSSC